jgi:hypothetical protein
MDFPKLHPANRCIYCGSSGGGLPLEDEHIIPMSLGGNIIFPKASCRKCSGITSNIEGYIARKVFWEFRLSTGIRSRRGTKDRPTELPLTVDFQSGDRRQFSLPISNHPSGVALLHFPLPGVMTGDSPSDNWEWVKIRHWSINSRLPNDIEGAKSFNFKFEIKNWHFGKFLAKVAHGFAVAHFGINAFDHWLPDLILGRHNNGAYIIGSEPDLPPPVNVDFRVGIDTWSSPEGARFVLVKLRLFAGMGLLVPGSLSTPVYCVIAGPIDPARHFVEGYQDLTST